MNATEFIHSKLGDKMWTHSKYPMHREELAKWLDEYAKLKESKISSNAVLAVASDSKENNKESEVPLPPKQKYTIELTHNEKVAVVRHFKNIFGGNDR